MGGSLYNVGDRNLRSVDRGYTTKSASELFSKKLHESLNPKNISVRECRDSDIHPNSLPIIIGLDVTGSMGKIPHNLLKTGLPTMMSKLIEKHLPDAAVCFVAVGDHKSDVAPIQIAQFESGDLELDTHLENTWLEGNGGGNGGESYFLPWYFANTKTSCDSLIKRNIKGFIFTIGDEHCHPSIDKDSLKQIFGDVEVSNILETKDILNTAQKSFNVFHINLSRDSSVISSWQSLLGENNIVCNDYTDIPNIIADKILEFESEEIVSEKNETSEMKITL